MIFLLTVYITFLFTSKKTIPWEWRNNVVYTNSYFSHPIFHYLFLFNFRLHSWRLTTTLSQKDLEILGVEKGKKSKSVFFTDVSISLSSLVIKGHLQEKYEPLISEWHQIEAGWTMTIDVTWPQMTNDLCNTDMALSGCW